MSLGGLGIIFSLRHHSTYTHSFGSLDTSNSGKLFNISSSRGVGPLFPVIHLLCVYIEREIELQIQTCTLLYRQFHLCKVQS